MHFETVPDKTINIEIICQEKMDENTEKLLKLTQQMKTKETEFDTKIQNLQKLDETADELIQMNTSTLFSLSQLSEKQRALDHEKYILKHELSALRHELMKSQMKYLEIKEISNQIIKQKEESKQTNDSKELALKAIENTQTDIAKTIQKCVHSDDMEIDSKELMTIALNLGKIISLMKEKNVITDSQDDIITRQSKVIDKLLQNKNEE